MKKPGSKELTTIERAQRYLTEVVSYWVGAGMREVGFPCRLSLVDPASIYRRNVSFRELLNEDIASGGNGRKCPSIGIGKCEDVLYRAFAPVHDSHHYTNNLMSPA